MYVVRQTCTKCGRATKYPSTAVTRPCPFCEPNATHSVEKPIPRTTEPPKPAAKMTRKRQPGGPAMMVGQ